MSEIRDQTPLSSELNGIYLVKMKRLGRLLASSRRLSPLLAVSIILGFVATRSFGGTPSLQSPPATNVKAPASARPASIKPDSPQNESIDGLRAAVKANPKDFKRSVQLADLLNEVKDHEEIISVLKNFVDRLSRQSLIKLSKAYREQKDPLNEFRMLELCLAKNSKDYVTLALLGDAYARAGRFEEALEKYTAARERNPKYRPAYIGMAHEFERTKQTYEARTVLNDIIKTFGAQPEDLTWLCRLYTTDGFLEKAIETCQTAIEKDPEQEENYVNLAVSLRDQEQGEKSQAIIKEAAGRFPSSESVQSTSGEIHLQQKKTPLAYQAFKRAAAADPKSVRALIGLADTAFALQKNSDALDAYSRACQIDRKKTRSLRFAIDKLRSRRDSDWLPKFEAALSQCP